MRNPYLPTQIFILFLSLAFVAYCDAQNNTSLHKDRVIGSKTIGTKHAKVFKSQPTHNGEAENVRCGMLDKNGHLWFGTTGHGVFKYDGTLFTLYTVEDGLGGNRVVAICEDRSGNILLGTEKGLYLYDGESIGEFIKNDLLGKVSISTLYLDSRGQIWIGTHHSGLYVYDGKTLTNLQSDDKVINDFDLTLNGISDIIEDNRGDIWLTSWAIAREGVIKFTGDSLIQLSKVHGLKDSLFYSALVDTTEKYWFGSRKNGLFFYENGVFEQISHEAGPVSGSVLDMLVDKDGFLWFTTGENGVYRYDPSAKLKGESGFKNFTTVDGLINNTVFTVVEDNKGNLWFGTGNVGLCRYDGKSFVNFSE